MRSNRMAIQFGFVPKQSPQRSKYSSISAPKNNNLKVEVKMDNNNTTFKELEEVINNRDTSEPAGFVLHEVGETPRVGDEISAAKAQTSENDIMHDDSSVMPVTQPTADRMASFVDQASLSPTPAPVVSAEVSNNDMPTDVSGDSSFEDASMETAKAADGISHVNVEAAADSVGEEDGYNSAMDLLRLIYDNEDEQAMLDKYGERWSLTGIIGTPFAEAKTMLADALDFFSFHVGELVSGLIDGSKVMGVIIDISEDFVSVFDGKKIATYVADQLEKTGKTFADVISVDDAPVIEPRATTSGRGLTAAKLPDEPDKT